MANHILLKQASGGFVTKVVAAGLAFIISVLFARYLGPENFGIYAMAMSAISILSTLAALGLPMLIVRETAVYTEGEHWGLLKGLIYRAHQWPMLASAFLIITLGVIAVAFMPPTWRTVVVLSIMMLPLLALNQIRASILRGMHWVVLADIPELLARPFLVLIMILGTISLTQIEPNGQWAIGIQLAATFLSFLLGAWLLKQRLPTQMSGAPAQFADQKWRIAGAVFLGVAIVSVAEGQVAILLLGSMAGPQHAGLYQAAFQLVTPLIFGLLAVNMALQSKLAAAWSIGDKKQAQLLATEAVRLSTGVALLASVVLMIFAEPFLGIFGAEYVEAATALKFLVLGQLFNAAAGSCGVVLSMTGHQKEVFRGVILALLANAICCVGLIPKFGIVGAAIAASTGLVTWNLYLWNRAKQLTGIKTSIL